MQISLSGFGLVSKIIFHQSFTSLLSFRHHNSPTNKNLRSVGRHVDMIHGDAIDNSC